MKQCPDGITNAEWVADIQRRAVVNLDRRKREVAAKAKKATAAAKAKKPRRLLAPSITAPTSSGSKAVSHR
jgi:hypothetical protein